MTERERLINKLFGKLGLKNIVTIETDKEREIVWNALDLYNRLNKVGDYVYRVKGNRIVKTPVLDVGRNGFVANIGNVYLEWFNYSEIGECVFLSEEEAKKKLEEK